MGNQTAKALSGITISDWLWRVGQSQDKIAFSDLFHAMAPRIKSYFFKLGCDESLADELAQQTMFQVWRKAHLFDRKKASASTWMFRVARNIRIDALRKIQRYDATEMDFDSISDETDDQETVFWKEEQDNLMRNAISNLSNDQITIVKLSFYNGLSHAEIAQKLYLPLGTVKSRMRTAFGKLKNELGEYL